SPPDASRSPSAWAGPSARAGTSFSGSSAIAIESVRVEKCPASRVLQRADLDQVIEEGGPSPHVGQRGRGGAVHVTPARAELAPVEAQGDGGPRPDGSRERDPRLESSPVVVDLD